MCTYGMMYWLILGEQFQFVTFKRLLNWSYPPYV